MHKADLRHHRVIEKLTVMKKKTFHMLCSVGFLPIGRKEDLFLSARGWGGVGQLQQKMLTCHLWSQSSASTI